ncbi:MAG: ACT domain-containing protein [Spirochaetota bacterium]
MNYAVITAIGPDRIGIMDDIAAEVVSAKGNIEELKAAVLGGEFAVIMLVSGGGGIVGDLERGLSGSGATKGLALTIKATGKPAPVTGIPYLVETVSLDTPGLVHSITAILRARGFNVEDLESSTEAAPWTGAPLFRMKVRVIAPVGAKVAALRADLAKAAEELDIDVSIHPLTANSSER